MKKLIMIIIGIAFLASCNNSTNPVPISDGTTPTLGMGSKETTNEKQALVLEVIDGGTYTYLRLEADGNEFWAAVTARQVETGKSYYYTESIWMNDFESKQLQKTFESILFIDYFGEQAINTNEVSELSTPAEHISTSREESLKITPAGGGISLEELFGNKEKYDGKEVLVSGKIVKISRNIMNLTWIHIQDGTSFEDEYDLTVTTNTTMEIEVDDIVSFKGTITLDKDFGAGYFYPVIMEKASIMVTVQ